MGTIFWGVFGTRIRPPGGWRAFRTRGFGVNDTKAKKRGGSIILTLITPPQPWPTLWPPQDFGSLVRRGGGVIPFWKRVLVQFFNYFLKWGCLQLGPRWGGSVFLICIKAYFWVDKNNIVIGKDSTQIKSIALHRSFSDRSFIYSLIEASHFCPSKQRLCTIEIEEPKFMREGGFGVPSSEKGLPSEKNRMGALLAAEASWNPQYRRDLAWYPCSNFEQCDTLQKRYLDYSTFFLVGVIFIWPQRTKNNWDSLFTVLWAMTAKWFFL